ncbi:hypothetical protein E1B28_004640 [Marasmius oreades]|uniref:IMD domain-containing protein n=1 Tax=Marasmius oreades TaxID=181124 RepID=A0A9P8AD67_9AGAR|nr:uncharacterized protein E1B28_004640 [Marasmius oreades]KAG7097274.1 hypothetical protein E1B28_004640 [Marasmius oreades]
MAPGRPRSLRSFAFGSSKRNPSPDARSPSPTFSETTNISGMNFGANGPTKIITRANLKASLQAYERLMDTCSEYRQALIGLSRATAAFADAMGDCSGLKGPSYETGTRLQAASGLHHLIGNHYHVLAATLDTNFEKPLRQHLETYRTIVNERSASYERALKERSDIIRQTEQGNLNRKARNLQSFREALAVLQRQVDELDELKVAHYHEIIEHEEQVWDVVQGKVCLVVRSTLDVYDKFTSKASDPVIEPMLQTVPDPFDSYGMSQSEDQIFSILPPLSIMPSVPSSTSTTTPLTRTPELEQLDSFPASASSGSWIPDNPNTIVFPTESAEWADVPSPPSSSSPRAASPTGHTTRRHSTPGAMPGHPRRKSESKLRSVLAVIDETRGRNRSSSKSQDDPSPTYDRPSTDNNVGLIQPQPQKRPSFSWSSPFSYGASADDPLHDDTTPRNSTAINDSPPLVGEVKDDQTIRETNYEPVPPAT